MLSGDPGSDLAVPGALLIPAALRKPRRSPLRSAEGVLSTVSLKKRDRDQEEAAGRTTAAKCSS